MSNPWRTIAISAIEAVLAQHEQTKKFFAEHARQLEEFRAVTAELRQLAHDEEVDELFNAEGGIPSDDSSGGPVE